MADLRDIIKGLVVSEKATSDHHRGQQYIYIQSGNGIEQASKSKSHRNDV